jgi:pilus assembly protein CpaE
MQGVPKRPEIPLKDFGEAIGIEPTHVIPFEPQLFGTAANNGQMIGEAGVGSKVAFVIESMAGHLCGRQPAAPKKSSLLENIPFLKR